MTTVERWWVKRDGEPKGPFPTAVLENNIRQGRVRPDDLLSLDGTHWSKGREIGRFDTLWATESEVLPLPEERATERRSSPADGGQRAPEERRTPEDPELLARRERANRVWTGLRPQPVRIAWPPFLILGALVAVVFLLSTRGTRLGADDARCSAEPSPGLNWEFCNLAGRELRGKDLSGINLRSAKLSGLDLTGASLERADLAYADLSGATLSDVNLRNARLSGARLANALLSETDFSGADLSYADLSQARVSGAVFDGARFTDTLLASGQPCSDESGKTACARLMEPRPR